MKKLRILILNWRDIKNPAGGGAELLTHEMAKRWVAGGHTVTHFSAFFPQAKVKEEIDGVTYIRSGNWYNVHLIAFWKIVTKQLPQVDVVIDEVHGIPFFTIFYVKVPILCLACEVAKEIWDQMYPFPLNKIGAFLEKIYLIIYRNTSFLTISESTKQDLIDNGVKKDTITVLPMGFTYELPAKLPVKSHDPLFVFLGRVTPTKGIIDAIYAFSHIKAKLPQAKFILIGRGLPEYEEKIKILIEKLHLRSSVFLKGFVTNEEKFTYLAQAHVLFVPSTREGWGLIVPEANIVGTPVIVYNVPGLRDVVKNGINGVITTKNNSEALAQEAIKMLTDKNLYKKLSLSSKHYAKGMNWDDTARVGINEIIKCVNKK